MDTINDEGWVKLHRKIQRSSVFQNEGLLKVWIWCLVKANHEDRWIPISTGKGTTEVLVKRGQFVFGRKSAAKALGMDESTIYKRMRKLENMENLNTQSNTHYSIVTILNYELYQGSKNDEVTGKVTGKEHPSNTNKNVRNKILFVEGSEPLRLATLLLEEIRKNKPDFKEPNLQTWAKEIDVMLRRDNRSADRIEKVIQWVQADHGDGTGRWKGWAAVILSAGKLREKFDELEMKMEATDARRSKSSW